MVFSRFAGPGSADNPPSRQVRRREVLGKGTTQTVREVPWWIVIMAVYLGFYNVSSSLAPLTTYHRSRLYTRERW